MSSERWQKIEDVFQTALDLSPEERKRYLTKACFRDADLRLEVERLIAQYEQAGDFLDEPLQKQSGPLAWPATTDNHIDPVIGQLIGAYRVEREIGRGGMGTVYLAERADNVFRKQVAIKIVKRGMDTDHVLLRFSHERQILAALDHPNIARLIDGGATDVGQSYFVMEYIEGTALYRYCDTKRLDIRERLRLFCSICEAVEYAHQKRVIHRDIKPGNIMISTAGVPKLVDFGIAKLLDPALVLDTVPQTATAMRMMTVEYASPEQVQRFPVTFQSDVYSLGVVLYELLSGHRPYSFRSRLPHEMARIVTEGKITPPSVVVNSSENLVPSGDLSQHPMTVSTVGLLRSATVENLQLALAGSLDKLILKALSKDQRQRYQSAAALRDDIVSFLEGRSIVFPDFTISSLKDLQAANLPPQQVDQISIAVLPFKLLGPKTSGDTGDEYLIVGLADALTVRLSNVSRLVVRPTSSVLQYEHTSDPFDAGQQLAVDFVVEGSIRRAGDVLRVTVRLLSVDEKGARWAGKFDEKSANVLQLEDLLSSQVAGALIPQLTVEERERLARRSTNNPKAFEAYIRARHQFLGLTEAGLAKSLKEYQRAIALDPNYALAFAGIAEYFIFLGIFGIMSFGESAGAAREAARTAVELDDTLAEAHAALSFALVSYDFAWAEAEVHYKRAIELNPNSATAHNWYTFLLLQEGRFDEAFTEVKRTLELDPVSPLVQASLAWCYYHSHRFDEALKVYRRVIEAEPRFGYCRTVFSWALRCAEKHQEAVLQAEKAIENAGEGQLYLAGLGAAYAGAGRIVDAGRIIDRLGELSRNAYVSPYCLAAIHCALGNRDTALTLLDKAVAIGDAWVLWLVVDPQFDTLRSDRRFDEIVARTKNPGVQRVQAIPSTSHRNRGERLIAVLPFKLLTGTPDENTDDSFLRVGLTDALITRLSNVRRLVVRPTSSVLRYSYTLRDPFEAGRELGVEFVLDGHMRRAGDRLRLSVQLLNVNERSAGWAATFDEKAADVFTLEDTISTRVAEALIPQLSGDEREGLNKRGTNNTEAFEAYLRGRYYWTALTEDGLGKAFSCFQSAVALDPTYAAAYAGIAEYHCWMAVFGLMPPASCLAAAREAAKRSVTLDDTLAEAHTAHALALLTHETQWTVAEERFRRAIQLNRNYATAHVHYACQLAMEGRFDESIAEARISSELDPLNPFNAYIFAWCLYQARRYDESIARCRALIQSDPRYSPIHSCLSMVLRQTGRYAEGVEEARKTIELAGDVPMYTASLGAAFVDAGQIPEARRLLSQLNAASQKRYISPYHRALVYVGLGEHETAIDLFEESVAVSDPWIVWLRVEPQLDPLRRHSRFIGLLNRTFENK